MITEKPHVTRKPRKAKNAPRQNAAVHNVTNTLAQLRAGTGWTQAEAAKAMGISKGQYVKLENSTRNLTEESIRAAARAFNVDPGPILQGGGKVPVVGQVVGDSYRSIAYNGPTQDGFGMAPMQPGNTTRTVAVVVSGGSTWGPIKENWLIYFDGEPSPIGEDDYGELCVIWPADGSGPVVRTPFPGRFQNRYDLENDSGPTQRDVEIIGVSRVTNIVPRSKSPIRSVNEPSNDWRPPEPSRKVG